MNTNWNHAEPCQARGLAMSASGSVVAATSLAIRVRGGAAVDLGAGVYAVPATGAFAHKGPHPWRPPIT